MNLCTIFVYRNVKYTFKISLRLHKKTRSRIYIVFQTPSLQALYKYDQSYPRNIHKYLHTFSIIITISYILQKKEQILLVLLFFL